jgi:hypothetical protein
MARNAQQAKRFERFRDALAAGQTVPDAARAAGYSESFANSGAYALAVEARKPRVSYLPLCGPRSVPRAKPDAWARWWEQTRSGRWEPTE